MIVARCGKFMYRLMLIFNRLSFGCTVACCCLCRIISLAKAIYVHFHSWSRRIFGMAVCCQVVFLYFSYFFSLFLLLFCRARAIQLPCDITKCVYLSYENNKKVCICALTLRTTDGMTTVWFLVPSLRSTGADFEHCRYSNFLHIFAFLLSFEFLLLLLLLLLLMMIMIVNHNEIKD